MGIKDQYINRKAKFLNSGLCKENKELYSEFFKYQEYKLKRANNLTQIDESSYKTLYSYINYLKNINAWFNNKPLKDLTKVDIKRVYDGLEDGKILNQKGGPFKDRRSYYNKIFRSKLFEMIGKKELAISVMQFYKKEEREEVRYIELDTFKDLVNVAIKPEHKLLLWLAFDIGENINSLLQLKKQQFVRQVNPYSKEIEYSINLPKESLKRSRTTRSEITNFNETVKYADIILKDLKNDELVFKFEYRNAKKILDRAVKITKAVCIPKGQTVTWKDLRSSMACYLLKEGWTTDEVNARLGHRPSSDEIDKYINFLAIDRHRPKKKLYDSSIAKLTEEIQEMQKREKLYQARLDRISELIQKKAITEIKSKQK